MQTCEERCSNGKFEFNASARATVQDLEFSRIDIVVVGNRGNCTVYADRGQSMRTLEKSSAAIVRATLSAFVVASLDLRRSAGRLAHLWILRVLSALHEHREYSCDSDEDHRSGDRSSTVQLLFRA